MLYFASYESRRVCRCVLGAEFYSLADAFDYAYVMSHDLEDLLGQWIPLRKFTDSHSLCGVIVKNSTTAERRLMIVIKDVRES